MAVAGTIFDLNSFINSAPVLFETDSTLNELHPHEFIHRFKIDNDYISCIKWLDEYYISGSDLFKILNFKFDKFGRIITNLKKFHEGIFSDLRNLRTGFDSILEEPRSMLLDLLFKYGAIRTQKKQKVFRWYSVPYDRLFLDALERDLKREFKGLAASTQPIREPSFSFIYTSLKPLRQQFDEYNLSSTFLLNSFDGSDLYKKRKNLKKILTESQTSNENEFKTLLPSTDSSNNNLIHLIESKNIRSFKCDECDKAFKRLEHLTRHQRSHTKERPFSCKICGKSFSRSDNLAAHNRTHFKERRGRGRPSTNSKSNSVATTYSTTTTDSDTFSDTSSLNLSLTSFGSPSDSNISSRPSTSSNHWTSSPMPYHQPKSIDLHEIPSIPFSLSFDQQFEPSSGPIRRHRSETPSSNCQLSFSSNDYDNHQFYAPSSFPSYDIPTTSSNTYATTGAALRTQSLPYPTNHYNDFVMEDDFKTPTVDHFDFSTTQKLSSLGLTDYNMNNVGNQNIFAYEPPPITTTTTTQVSDPSCSTPIQIPDNNHFLNYHYYNSFDEEG